MAPKATAADPGRQLMIKTKACQRLIKEAAYYQTEVKENEGKLAKMKEEKRDPYDIKKFEEVLGESYMMIPESQARVKKNLEELSLFLEIHADEVKSDGEWMVTAKAILADHNISVKTASDVPETNVDDLKDGESF